ncbi:MAG: MBL fold metallo-hydrolase [Anaerolineae bacterium]|nr:MBL fold metallo-hydrolase [Anaerolineae bacterium]
MSTNQSIHIKFWGVRGSYPVPGTDTVDFGGNTACVEVRAREQTIILDAGTGIIGLGRSLIDRARQAGSDLEATILFSHLHHDHTQGFPFFSPAYSPAARLHFFGPASFEKSLDMVLAHNQMPPMFPVTLQEMASTKDIHDIQGGDVILLGENNGSVALRSASQIRSSSLLTDMVLIRAHRSYAHPGGVLAYRIEYAGKSLVYATDTEGYVGTDRRLVSFAQGANVLIHDAQFTEEHYNGQRNGLPSTQGHGHSTASMACEVAEAAGVEQLVLFHHDPSYADETIRGIEMQAQSLFPNVTAAYEGLEITLDNTEQTIKQDLLTNPALVS